MTETVPASPQMFLLVATSGKRSLTPLLTSLEGCAKPHGFAGAIVAQNGPRRLNGLTTGVHAGAAPVSYIHVKRANKSHALNVALSRLPDDALVVFTDDDVRFDQNFLLAYAEAARGNAASVVLGGPVHVTGMLAPAELRSHIPHSMQGWEPTEGDVASGRLRFLGANWAAYVGNVKAAGGFDPRFGPGSRLRATGCESMLQEGLRRADSSFVYVPEAQVWHEVNPEQYGFVWILGRHYRMGVSKGIQQRLDDRASSRGPQAIAGRFWRLLRRFGFTCGVLILSPLNPSKVGLLALWRRPAFAAGNLLGYVATMPPRGNPDKIEGARDQATQVSGR